MQKNSQLSFFGISKVLDSGVQNCKNMASELDESMGPKQDSQGKEFAVFFHKPSVREKIGTLQTAPSTTEEEFNFLEASCALELT